MQAKPHEPDTAEPDDNREEAALALLQAAFYVITGLWPLVSMGTFEKVTGPKTDRWLVKTVGALITVTGAVLAVCGARRTVSPETRLLAVGSAASLTAIDVVYVGKRRISRIYLLDALAEVALITLWILAWSRARR